ncbi:hypothetical protein K432DRAFT_389448 [Lepidopterella palustris CBS 459.81]|uniref:Uncharacterized protein n=1 Tax=Lepidopterella palustris CBS 459.81 TaxID=1314670 RepID=A0A8E2JJ80_9PEZI|nr:hypothetical protein K432DRAFT_389448 [Lepidopterella palustris CBS 459.81]
MVAANAKDKVYGLLGFPALWNILSEFKPDYEKSVEEMYIEVAIKIIEKSMSLDILSFTKLPPVTDNRMYSAKDKCLGWPKLPTFAARWVEQTMFHTLALYRLPPYKAPAEKLRPLLLQIHRKASLCFEESLLTKSSMPP